MKKYFALLFLFFLAGAAVIAQDPEVPVEPGLNIWAIVSVVLGVLASIFGVAFKKVKAKIDQVYSFLKEGLEVIFELTEALKDNNIDAEEVKALKQAVAEAKGAWKAMWNK